MEMDSSSEHHHQLLQEMGSQTLESMLASCTKPQHQQKKARPVETQPANCPRCESPNTKFCYYNNYSLSQPRYFCKSCRRYWTKGGTLRNVPIGGGCRRNNNNNNISSSSSSTSSKRTHDNHLIPSSSYDSNDLSLAFAKDFSIFGSYSHHGDHFLGSQLPMSGGVQNLNYGNQLMEMGNGVSGGSEMEVLWGFPWSGDGNALADVDSGGGLLSLNWQGLLNSPLM